MNHFVTEDQIIAALGEETESDYDYDEEQENLRIDFDDADYSLQEDYGRNEQPSLPVQSNSRSRVPRVPFEDPSNLFNFDAFEEGLLGSKTKLPAHFTSTATLLQYLSLFYTHSMSKDIRDTMNYQYDTQVQNMNLSDLFNGEVSMDPLTGELDSVADVNSVVQSNVVQLSNITAQNVYQFLVYNWSWAVLICRKKLNISQGPLLLMQLSIKFHIPCF